MGARTTGIGRPAGGWGVAALPARAPGRARTLALALALALACAPPVPAADRAPAGASRHAWAAAAALSRGVALQPTPAAGEGADADADVRLAAAVAAMGFRSVQLPWSLPAGSPEPDAALRRLDRLVDALLSHGLAVVLHDGQGGAGACGEHQARGPQAGALPPAAAWAARARRQSARPERLAFMLSLAPLAAHDAEQANRRLREVLGAIRASNPARPVVVAWGDAVNLPRLRLPPDPHLLVAIGNREPERFTHQGLADGLGADAWRGTGCCSAREAHLMGLPLDLAQAWSARHRVPVWLAGFGSAAAAPPAHRARHARLMRDEAEARGLGWASCALDGAFGLRQGSRDAQARLRDALLGR